MVGKQFFVPPVKFLKMHPSMLCVNLLRSINCTQKTSFCTFQIEFLTKIEFPAFSANRVLVEMPKNKACNRSEIVLKQEF